MNKKKGVSLGIIAFLGLAIILPRLSFKGNIPELKGWDEAADEIKVSAPDYTVRIYKEGGSWVINDEAYAADNDFIDSIENKIKDLKLLDLISEKGYTDRYDLTDEKRVHVRVSSGGTLLRDLYIGKGGATLNHVFVMVDDNPGIYLASGIMAEDFTRSIDELRDKTIVNLNRDSIESISVRYKGRTYSFYQKLTSENAGEDSAGAIDNSRKWYLTGFGNRLVAPERINSMLASFSPLRADTYPEGISERSLGRAQGIVRLRVQGDDIVLSIYGETREGKYYATSSESPYVFTISKWLTDRFFIERISDVFVE